MLITAAICTYRRPEQLRAAVESCRRQTLDRGAFKVLVVDNSPPGERPALSADMADIEYVTEDQPGLSNARNVAARRCGTPLIAYLDDDADADAGWLAALLEGFALDPAVAVVGGPILPDWGAPPPAWLHGRMLTYLSVLAWGGERPRYAEPHEWFAGANIAFRTEAIAAAGFFDTSLGRKGDGPVLLGNEELAMSDRIERTGGRRAYVPAALVRHHVPAERLTRNWFRRRAAWQAASDLMTRPEQFGEDLPARVQRAAAGYRQRWPRGGDVDPDEDPEGFRAQLRVIYLQTALLLSGADTDPGRAGAR